MVTLVLVSVLTELGYQPTQAGFLVALVGFLLYAVGHSFLSVPACIFDLMF